MYHGGKTRRRYNADARPGIGCRKSVRDGLGGDVRNWGKARKEEWYVENITAR